MPTRRLARTGSAGPAVARPRIAEEREGAVALGLGRRPGEGEPIRPVDRWRRRHLRRTGSRSASGLGLADHERAVHQVEGLGRAGRRGPLARHEARVGEVEQGERFGQLVADDRQIDRPMRVRGVDR